MTEWTIYNNKMAWGLLTDEQRAALARGYKDLQFQRYTKDGFVPVVQVGAFEEGIYRAVEAAPTPNSVDWGHVGDEIVAFATDQNEGSRAYNDIPKLSHDGWVGASSFIRASVFASFRRGTIAWDKSLIVRPGVQK